MSNEKQRMPVYFNNHEARPHADYYLPEGAYVPFFDLDNHGEQGRKARRVMAGDECVVARRVGVRDVQIDHYSLWKVLQRPAPEGSDVRVFYGTLIRSTTMPEVDAVGHSEFSIFFKPEGGFRRGSVIAE